MCKCDEHGSPQDSSPGGAFTGDFFAAAVAPSVPVAASLRTTTDEPGNLDVNPLPNPIPVPPLPKPVPLPKLCNLDFRDGCYVITHRPTGSLTTFEGTLRVDRTAPNAGPDNMIISGDLYSGPPPIAVPIPVPPLPIPLPPVIKPRIPIFARSRYQAYLKGTSLNVPVFSFGPCQVTLEADQFNYTQPSSGQFKGTFPSVASRHIVLKLTPATAPFPYSLTGGPYYEGRLLEGGVDKGSVTLAWVSKFFRRATVEIDTLTGSVRPAPVPDGSGGTDFFDTIFARTGWELTVINDQTNIPVPAGVTATNCWASADLHNLMTTVRNPSTNLDAEWRIHLIVVPAKLGCGRGVMYDTIGVPREACASFSDDGYPTGDSSNFGVAANKKQRDVPRAFLRSATHEITHTLNQIHQEQETSADNSIMTTTPSVADVLGGPTTGAPGVFPDQINLNHNATVRNHLNHMPDPVIRPGGWPFASWFPTGAPQASDRNQIDPSVLELTVTCTPERVVLGLPVMLQWTLTNRSAGPLLVPNDVSIEALFASIHITDNLGTERPMRPFEILCDRAKIAVLEPGQSVSASSRLFWSTAGFAFERPGRYHVVVSIVWSVHGVPFSVNKDIYVFIDYPTNDAENHAARKVLHPEVGKWVALGGGAYHLKEAVRRLAALQADSNTDGGAAKLLDGFAGLWPDHKRAADSGVEVPKGNKPANPGKSSRSRTKK